MVLTPPPPTQLKNVDQTQSILKYDILTENDKEIKEMIVIVDNLTRNLNTTTSCCFSDIIGVTRMAFNVDEALVKEEAIHILSGA